MLSINPIIMTNTGFKAKQQNNTMPTYYNGIYPQTKKTKTKTIIFSALGLATAAAGLYIAMIVAKKPPRMSFEELLNKKGLEFKNELLVSKETGEKFTGELRRSTGEYGKQSTYEKIETRKFANGIIQESTCKDCFGNEIEGKFYKDGKIFADIDIFYGREGKIFSFSIYKQNGIEFAEGHGKCKNKKDSAFKMCRGWLKNDWPENKDWFKKK